MQTDNLSVHALTSVTVCYLVQVAFGVSQEGDGMSCPHADRHSSETGGRAVQYRLCFHGDPAGHGAGSVVRATGVGVQSVLPMGIEERGKSVYGDCNMSCSIHMKIRYT